MASMGRYCKAYPVEQLRTYPAWEEKLENLAPIENEEDGSQQPRTALASDDYLFLQETYVVTDGIFLDEHVVFDGVTPEWKAFCTEQLGFEIPDYQRVEETAAAPEPATVAAAVPSIPETAAPAVT